MRGGAVRVAISGVWVVPSAGGRANCSTAVGRGGGWTATGGHSAAPHSTAAALAAVPLSLRSAVALREATPEGKRVPHGGGCTCHTRKEQRRLCSSSGTFADGSRPYIPGQSVQEKYPIIQLPARSLWCKQYTLDPLLLQKGEYADLVREVMDARSYYQYPSMSAPQTGWNVQMFTLFDGSVFINPVNLDEEAWRAEAAQRGMPWVNYEEEKLRELREQRLTGFAWEPCASSGFMLHYIERPLTVRVRALDAQGKPFTVSLDKMRARMALHELDHLNGVLFTRRVVDTDHVVPMEGFVSMSDWSDDYPSLEARSTFLYTVFTPPYSFVADSVPDGNLLDRKFEDGIYPGCELDRQQRIETTAMEAVHRQAWRGAKSRGDAGYRPVEAPLLEGSSRGDEEEEGRTDTSSSPPCPPTS